MMVVMLLVPSLLLSPDLPSRSPVVQIQSGVQVILIPLLYSLYIYIYIRCLQL